ncbi:hypothetical protein LINPERPRIM_LOCUS2957 [Linum perenne]
MLGDIAQEAVHVLLPEVLHKMFVCATWHLREQAGVPLLQPVEDQRRRPQVSLDRYYPLF